MLTMGPQKTVTDQPDGPQGRTMNLTYVKNDQENFECTFNRSTMGQDFPSKVASAHIYRSWAGGLQHRQHTPILTPNSACASFFAAVLVARTHQRQVAYTRTQGTSPTGTHTLHHARAQPVQALIHAHAAHDRRQRCARPHAPPMLALLLGMSAMFKLTLRPDKLE